MKRAGRYQDYPGTPETQLTTYCELVIVLECEKPKAIEISQLVGNHMQGDDALLQIRFSTYEAEKQ